MSAQHLDLVVNPASGGGRAAKTLPTFLDSLSAHGIRGVVHVSRDAGHCRSLVRDIADSGATRLAVCGGDGTLHLAVQELAGRETALAILPVGTGDDNARTLGIPLKDPVAAAGVIADGNIRTIDLAHVEAADGTQRYYLGVLSAGFDSFVNERANRMTWPKGKARYVVAITGELRTFRPTRYEALIDGARVEEPAMLVAIGNGISYGGGMRICPAADPSDGTLDVTWLGAVPTSTFIRLFPSVFSGTHVDKPFVTTYRGRSIRLEAAGQLAYADGERVGPLPITVESRPGALRVIAPSGVGVV